MAAAAVLEEAMRRGTGSVGDDDVAARRAEEAAIRRHEAASWLRKTVGAVCAKDLPEEPSEEEFQLGLRNGIVLCNALNKAQPGAIPKIVGVPSDTAVPADGSALCAYQYFENLRNFLVVIQDFGLPTFEVSDLEKGGKSVRIVDCILALKSFSESKKTGRQAACKYGGIPKPLASGKYFILKNSDAFMNKNARMHSEEATQNAFPGEQKLSPDCSPESYETTTDSLSAVVRTILLDKKPEEVPLIVESLLSKVIQEYEHRFANQNLMDEEKQNILTTKEEANFAVNGSNAAQKFQLKEEINFDLQHKQIKELRGTVSSIKSGMEQLKWHYSEEFTKLGKHLYSLSNAASGYHKVLEENRKLYNQIQDLKGNIRVYCRVRPFLPGQISSLSSVAGMEERTIAIMTPTKYGKDGSKSFTFNKVFGPAATQDEVFSDMQPLIRSVLDGFNVCIFAYGQTGSGKTYTMSGPKVLTEESLGVNYRALNDLFNLQAQRKGTIDYDISVQMIEIYNEQVRDLLQDTGNRRLEIKNTSQKGLAVPDASMVPVTSTSDVVELMNQGQKNRAVGSTAINDRSSRSHSCLTVHVQGRDLTSGTVLRGCMHLVDLAGSERVDKSEVVGDRLKEAQYINKSLSALGDVIASLSQKNTHVPYRNSKLTQLLQDSLGGQAKTLMFVHISPELDAVGETISTLKFAERVASVELGAAKPNKEGSEIRELKEQIAFLKAALAKKEGEPENILSTQSSPSIYRIRKGNATPAAPKDRQPMEEDGNLEVQNVFTPAQKRSKMHLSGILTENNSSNSVQNCNGPQKEIRLGGWVDKMALGDDHFENSNSNVELEPDTAQLPTSFYQIHSPMQQSCRTESIPSVGLHGFDSATSCSNQEIGMSTMGLKASRIANRGASTIKKPEATSMRSSNLASKSPLSQKKLQTPTRNRNQLTLSSIGGRRTPNGKIGIAK
ncbi:kinesin-like protein KIN-14Q [Sorghum bicolor]|uniref:Kinesin motor domain-containing protein n=1 Tax=Sorghum bicolor TaxID=4558 RepID=A0A1B6PDA1_SORBI|nr:kinesin-like protein KIN-14Q [Sorghum bicolor]KXG23658.1 hypothetical protein SORBI_3008G123000 [Sorghum bicolor]|eukprot:XP_021302045.1 kinesin-like protein KIN-14Q [Sorghum bicolor]